MNRAVSFPAIKFSPHIIDLVSSEFFYIDPLPISDLGGPVKVGDFLIWPEIEGNEAFFTLNVPRLQDFTMTVQQEAYNNTVRMSGSSVVFVVSIYAQEDLAAIEHYRESWSSALKNAGYEAKEWKFVDIIPVEEANRDLAIYIPQWIFSPLHLRNLQATVNLPQDHLKSEPKVILNNNLGTVIFMIELSEIGTQIWKEALEQHRGDKIPATCEIKASYYTQSKGQVVPIEQNLSTTVGNLGKNLGAESVRVVNSQLSGEAKIIVSGHQSIENVVVELHPKNGQPVSQNFGQEGGQLSAIITANDLREVEIDWNAKVSFRSAGWPIVRDSGKLSFATNDSTVIVKPDVWIIEYTIITILLDNNGNVIANSASSDLANRIQCELSYSAPFLEGVDALHSTFETSSQSMTKIGFPKPPGQPDGSLKLSVFAKRQQKNNLITRMLHPDETLVIARIDPNAQISIITNKDPVNEFSWEAEMLGLLAEFK
ncbi:hypothetical protein [Neobacillus drentensis]|uniref:hypothetical protein n=1 Tax=Neobacillus drentensis TaxID=220684 RepID=UPI002FFEBE9B